MKTYSPQLHCKSDNASGTCTGRPQIMEVCDQGLKMLVIRASPLMRYASSAVSCPLSGALRESVWADPLRRQEIGCVATRSHASFEMFDPSWPWSICCCMRWSRSAVFITHDLSCACFISFLTMMAQPLGTKHRGDRLSMLVGAPSQKMLLSTWLPHKKIEPHKQLRKQLQSKSCCQKVKCEHSLQAITWKRIQNISCRPWFQIMPSQSNFRSTHDTPIVATGSR